MDFEEFRSLMTEQYGESEEYWGPLSDAVVLRFELDGSGNAFSRYKGKAVYAGWGHKDTIQSGEIWICSLTLNPKSGGKLLRNPNSEDRFIVPL